MMTENNSQPQTSTTRVGLKYGIFTAAASLLISMIVALLRMPADSLISYLSLFIFIAGIAYGIIEFRRGNDGFVSFGQAFGLGMVVSGFSGLINGLISLIYMRLIDPNSTKELRQEMLLALEKTYSDDQIEKIRPWIDWMASPGAIFFMQVIGSLFLGLIISLVAGLVFKKDRSPFD